MQRLLLTLLLCSLSVTTGHAIQLHWASGESNINFTSATRCTLVIEADNSSYSLPPEWHLLWTARGFRRLPVVLDSTSVDTLSAHVVELGEPTRVERAANIHVATIASDATQAITSAEYVLDLPAGSAGNLQVIASEASGTPHQRTIYRSPIVTFNGGIDAPLPPAIVQARTNGGQSDVTLQVQGVGLTSAASVAVVSPDASWRIPLEIEETTDTTISARADVSLPEADAVLEVTVDGGSSSANQLLTAACTGANAVEFEKFNFLLYVDPNPGVSTKDFDLYFNQNEIGGPHPPLFHLVYIRHVDSPAAESTLAHAWSHDMVHWRVDTTAFLYGRRAFSTDLQRWDREGVWAPSIVAQGDSVFMFYTGLDANNDQTIGYASTARFDTCNTEWTRHDKPTYTTLNTSWAVRRKHILGLGRQFRDPYIFRHPHPDSAGYFFMVFVAADSADVTPTSAPPRPLGLREIAIQTTLRGG